MLLLFMLINPPTSINCIIIRTSDKRKKLHDHHVEIS